ARTPESRRFLCLQGSLRSQGALATRILDLHQRGRGCRRRCRGYLFSAIIGDVAITSALLIDPIFKQHETGAGHPERPERYDALTRALDRAGLTKSLLHVATRPATEDEIALC